MGNEQSQSDHESWDGVKSYVAKRREEVIAAATKSAESQQKAGDLTTQNLSEQPSSTAVIDLSSSSPEDGGTCLSASDGVDLVSETSLENEGLPTKSTSEGRPHKDSRLRPVLDSENPMPRHSPTQSEPLIAKPTHEVNPSQSTGIPSIETASSTERSSAFSIGPRSPPTGASSNKRPLSNHEDGKEPSSSKPSKVLKPDPITSTLSSKMARSSSTMKEEGPPKWYHDLPLPKGRSRNSGDAETMLSSLKTMIKKCQTSIPEKRPELFLNIQHKLHTIAFLDLTGSILKSHRMLHNQDGLPQLFNPNFSAGISWPWYMRADAEEQYNKWSRRVFQTDLMRGIQFDVSVSDQSGEKRRGDRIDPSYKFKVSAHYYGNGDLINGQWWPLQLCALRDGAHGSSQGGICGSEDREGAYSIIMSGDHDYPDKDHGDWVLYCGTDSADGTVTANTRLMIKSAETRTAVRVIRSWKVKSEFAPVRGLRYDGLYTVTSFERLDGALSTRQRHRFRLKRCPDQDPIRGGTGPESRPTAQELGAYGEHQRLSGKKHRAGG